MDLFSGPDPAPPVMPVVKAPPVMPVPNDKAVAAAKRKQLAAQSANAMTRQATVANMQGTGVGTVDTLA